MRAAYGVMAAIMAPVVVSIHSIVGLDFAGAATPGWHSTEFPPFFVCGASLSGLCHRVAARDPAAAAAQLEDHDDRPAFRRAVQALAHEQSLYLPMRISWMPSPPSTAAIAPSG